MLRFEENLKFVREPEDYFRGVGQGEALPTPTNILLFVRRTKDKLQQEALQNRSHHRFVLIFNLETAGHVHVDHLVVPLRPGQALLVLPYQFHHFSQLSSSSLRWFFCTFELKGAAFLEPMRNRVVGVGDSAIAARDRLLEEWRRCGWADRRGESREQLLQAALLRLLLELKRDLRSSAADLPPEPRDSLLRTINRLMSERRGRTAHVSDLAMELDLSESRLRARFRKAAGIPLGAYIQNYRLNRAMALLRTTDLPIAEIAEESGFGSPQAFSRTFKQETGQSPRIYRQS